jgi:NAD(P)-dependent dehydrogenase (short-subunit alcohol dehydrogenase family)
MDYNLSNRVIIITGANSGIGKPATIPIAYRSMKRGAVALVFVYCWSVVLLYRLA